MRVATRQRTRARRSRRLLRSLFGMLLLAAWRTAVPAVDDVALTWRVISNLDERGFLAELVVHNGSDEPLPADGWTLYFNFWREIVDTSPAADVSIEHVNGDFYGLRPSATFEPIAPGESHAIRLLSRNHAISESDAPDGFYFVWGDPETGTIQRLEDPAVEPLTASEQTSRGRADELPVDTAARRYEDNLAVGAVAPEAVPLIVPRPVALTRTAGSVGVDGDWRIVHDPALAREADYLAQALSPLLGERLATGTAPAQPARTIRLVLDASADAVSEAYELRVEPGAGITIAGVDAAGVFYGLQSLRALIPATAYVRADGAVSVPAVTVADRPRFGYRGLHLDVARNFQPIDAVMRLLDLMATYKLNRFHFHLSDDEGWRIEIDALPELTSVGGRRGHTLTEAEHLMPSLGSGPSTDSRGSGHYTREQFVGLLRFAAARHITVIPEIDMPGHARAAIVAMESRRRRLERAGRPDEASRFALAHPEDESVYRSVQMWSGNVVDVCMESTYRFLEIVVDELASIYADAGAPFESVHVGGDEVPAGAWTGSPACAELIASVPELDGVADLKGYFLHRFDAMLNRHGVTTGGWEEIALTEIEDRGRIRKAPNPEFLDAGFRAYVWNAVWGWGAEDTAYELANAGFPIVLANATNLYFDFAYAKHPEEPGLYWAGFVDTKDPFAFAPLDLYEVATEDLLGRTIPGDRYDVWTALTASGRANVLGLQGQLWSENIRSDARLEYMAWPRVISLAERAWAEQPAWARIDDDAARREALDADWNVFANALGRRELARLDYLYGGVRYRLPPPGAVIRDGRLYANTALPGLVIRYTTDGSQPSAESAEYTDPVDVGDDAGPPIRLKTFSSRGRGSRTVVVAR